MNEKQKQINELQDIGDNLSMVITQLGVGESDINTHTATTILNNALSQVQNGINVLKRDSVESAPSVDWRESPYDAKYHAFDQDGRGYWYENKPTKTKKCWVLDGFWQMESGLFWIGDWENSLDKYEF